MNEEIFLKNSSEVKTHEITPWLLVKERYYKPDSVYLFYILKNASLTSSNILITINELDIDGEVGEYFLIGAGSKPFDGPPPLLLTTVEAQKQYLVDDAAAYVALVTKSSLGIYKGFNITWEHTGTVIKVPEIDEKEDMRESAPICIYNITAAKEEFKKSDGWFEDFRQQLAEVATNYTKEFKKDSFTSENKIETSSVSVFRISAKIKVNETQEALYAMVKITKDSAKGRAAFEFHELHEIISIYSKTAPKDRFEFGACPERKLPESWGKFGLFLLIPVVCLALLVWIWKHSPAADYFERRRRQKRASQFEFSNFYQNESTAAENTYSNVPQIVINNEPNTLNECLSPDESEDELYNKRFCRRRSDEIELQRLSNRNDKFVGKTQGESNAAFVGDEGHTELVDQNHQEESRDHTYETVNSTVSLWENTKL